MQSWGEKGKERYTKSQVGYISAIWRADLIGLISTKIGKVVGVHDVIIHSNFGLNISRGFRSTGGQNFRFPIDFAGHRYNSAAADTSYLNLWVCKHAAHHLFMHLVEMD